MTSENTKKIGVIYAFIDTNIFIRTLTQGKPGCEFQYFDDLQTLVSNKAIQLLVPSVVLYELEKQKRNLNSDVDKAFSVLQSAIPAEEKVWSEIQDVRMHLLEELSNAQQAKQQQWEEFYEKVIQFLNSEKITKIPYTPEIMCRAKIRIMRGAKPKQDQDAAIIESLISFFETRDTKNSLLMFCSENHSDFAVEYSSSHDKRDRSFSLHPDIAQDLPESSYFDQLKKALDAVNLGYENIPCSSEIAKLQAIETDIDDVFDGYGFPDEYMEQLAEIENIQTQGFLTKIAPQLPEGLVLRRAAACKHIEEMLQECRKCESWDDSSEDKLSKWLEYVPENMIPYTSLVKILQIEEGVERYLKIHQEMKPADRD